jgi:hypothetical protein
LWLCPCKFFPNPSMAHSTGKKEELYIDIGVYGTTQKIDTFELQKTTKKFEKMAIENNG